ncbi:MAG TPA: energy transducer TonB [Kamptonema sp.]|nr:energy transducer TonB [Kamptonema sp.]
MPYSSSFTFIGEQLRQPSWWAAIASISIHGILGVSTPVLSVFSPPQKPPGKVEVVQLTPAEMSRLPQTLPAQISTPKFDLSPIPAPPNVIPPLPPAPSDLQFPSLPPGMSSFLPPRSSLPSLNSLPPSNTVPSTPPPNRPLSTINPPPPQPQPNLIIPPPLQGGPLPPPPTVRNDPQTENDLDKYRNADSRRPQFDPPRIYTPDDFPQNGTTSDPNKVAVNPDPKQVPPTSGNPGENPGTTAPTPSVQDPTKRNRLAESPMVTAMRQKMEAERQAGQKPNPDTQTGSISRSNEQDMAFAKTYSSLFTKFQQAYPGLEMTRYVFVPVAYPKEACSQKLEDKVIYGVIVKPSGAIAAAPELLATKGYNVLDLAAKNAISTYRFPATSAPKLYPLVFEFKYDEKVCSGLQPVAPSPSPKPSPTPQPPQSSPTPQPPQSSPTPSPAPQPQQSAPQSPSASPVPQQSTPPSPTPTPETSPTPTPETSSTPTPTPESSPTPTPETSPTPTPESSVSPTPTPESSPTPTPESTVN